MRKSIILLIIFILMPIYFLNGNKNKVKSTIETKQQIFSHKQLITDGRVWDLAFEDLNKDSSPDLVIANWFKPPTIYYNDGKGVFAEKIKNLTKSSTMTLGDIDLNGHIDMVFGKTIWLNNGNDQFTKHGDFDTEGHIFGLWLKDIDNDGDLDLFYSTSIVENSLILIKNSTKN